jgi:hypothetical protein
VEAAASTGTGGGARFVSESLRALIDLEDTASDSFSSRAGGLIGFSGALIALLTGLGQGAAAGEMHLGAVGQPLFSILFAVAELLLLTAVYYGVKVVVPQSHGRLPRKLFEDVRMERISVDDADWNLAELRTELYTRVLAANDARARALKTGFRLQVAALVLVAAQAIVLAINGVG